MTGKIADPAVAGRVELAIRRLDSLSTLPCVAVRFLSQLLQAQFSPSALADTIESDPALSARIFSLMHEQGLSFTDGKVSVRRALDKLPPQAVRDAVVSVKVCNAFDDGAEQGRTSVEKQLVQHCLAVACCTRNIAEIISPQIDSQLAYSAGLLHDIGKLALRQVMPKSFARIVEEAKSQSRSTCTIERKHLGLDHTTLGKRLAQSWHLPEQITLAIWLHHSDTMTISQEMGQARIAQVVQLADSIARQCDIGRSGSYDLPDRTEQIAQSLAIRPGQLERIRQQLGEQVSERAQVLGLDIPNAANRYCDTLHAAMVWAIEDNSRLSVENRGLQTTSSHFDFMRDFLLSIDSNSPAIDVAENFAVRWQKFYQTGKVCLYLVPPAGPQTLEAVVVETLGKTRTVYLEASADSAPIPKAVSNKFAILDADHYLDWLFEQLDVEFDLSQSKLMPLLSDSGAVGAIVFELRYPGDAELFRADFEASTSIAGSVLDMVFACCGQQHFAERFAYLLGKARPPQQQSISTPPLNALAEMAAGAAHELNNPLSVISGRAELLAGAETDPEKKRILEQIHQNAGEISVIIDDLMTFAKPPEPRTARTDIRQVLEEAIQLASQKIKVEHINVQIEAADGLNDVFVDSAQIVSAIANIICNSLESYTDKMGPIKITADPSDDFVQLQVSDLGCGMDAETIRKATQLFFSGRPAGRKRGMGLAHAQRLIELNNGSLKIKSQPGTGTIVTVLLRTAEKQKT
jgi:putative nucleotidyltransferase with HDIG domain